MQVPGATEVRCQYRTGAQVDNETEFFFAPLLFMVSAVVMTFCSTNQTNQTLAEETKSTPQTRAVLQFPKQSVGRIYAVKDDVDFSQRRIALKNIAAAQGLFERPKGQALSLELNYAGGMDLSFLKNLKANDLIGIDNDDIAIDCSGLAALQHLAGLKRLILRNSDFSDKECAYLKNLPLEYMDISKTLITGSGLSVCKTLTHLRMLVLSYNSLDSTAAAALAGMPKLEELHLTSTNIGDSDLANIAKIKTLTHLRVSDNKRITDKGIASLAALPNLRMLDAPGTSVSINCLSSLKKMRNLTSLTISSPKISTSEFFQIAHQLPNCRVEDNKKTKIPAEMFSPLH